MTSNCKGKRVGVWGTKRWGEGPIKRPRKRRGRGATQGKINTLSNKRNCILKTEKGLGGGEKKSKQQKKKLKKGKKRSMGRRGGNAGLPGKAKGSRTCSGFPGTSQYGCPCGRCIGGWGDPPRRVKGTWKWVKD